MSTFKMIKFGSGKRFKTLGREFFVLHEFFQVLLSRFNVNQRELFRVIKNYLKFLAAKPKQNEQTNVLKVECGCISYSCCAGRGIDTLPVPGSLWVHGPSSLGDGFRPCSFIPSLANLLKEASILYLPSLIFTVP